ncbi:hypothetical protein EJ06DRAFT_288038 [Trichodelitschia bisporula]|uniref:TeaA receptor TeaR n=1 Tax=Trichodelitschia bisporula TaxID=703511 RepID=A0A6G1I6J7_9PEZI|nr:hypothetical protein EJ06DRAFT_288038 [Trichodelitschia bisporula]
MATISATQAIRTLTPPSSSHGGRGGWDYAVPNNENLVMGDKAHSSMEPVARLPHGLRQPFTHQPNGFSKTSPPRSDTFDSQLSRTTSEGDLLAPSHTKNLSRKHSDISNASAQDSLFDPYKADPATKMIGPRENPSKRKQANGVKTTPEEDANNWIHRDKLAQIESRELIEAGFRVPARVTSSGPKSAGSSLHKADQSIDRTTDAPAYSEPIGPKREDKRQRTVSPIPGEYGDEPVIEFELRTPEEVAAEQEARSPYFCLPPARGAGSRIPIAKQSPVPVPSTFIERDSPLPRSRNTSGTWTGIDGRPRGNSVGSQVLLDDDEALRPHTPVRHSSASEKQSPPKSKVPSKITPGGRKTGGARNSSNTKSRNSSQQAQKESPNRRPGTSSGIPRPSTGHRPEGEAPWIASMYKPDPRLPPDQQILPTHAKRMAQEQWEKEGKVGSLYDREFRLLNTEDFTRPEPKSLKDMPPPPEQEERTKTTTVTAKQLQPSPMASPRSASSGRPGTRDTEHGGYRTMPTIHKSTPTPTRPSSPKEAPVVEAHDRSKTPPEEKENKKEKQGLCGCCIIM